MADSNLIRRATRIIGMKVWVSDQEEDFGRVKGLIFDSSGRGVIGLWVKPWDVMRRRRGLLMTDVKYFGKGQLKVATAKSLMGGVRFARVRDEGGRCLELLDTDAIDESGESLGKIVDATIDVKTGRVRTLEVSRGLMADIVERPMRFRPSAIAEIKPETIVFRAAEALPEPKRPRSEFAKTAEELAGRAGRAAGTGYVKARNAWRKLGSGK